MSSLRPIALVGPTASGKSGLGIRLAQQLNGEVINTDAMQLYRGMDIGTAKLTVAEREGVPHHLLDILEVTETAAVADYQQRARACVEQLMAAGRRPILVGGSGLYVQAIVDDFQFPDTDPQIRAELEVELAEVGSAALYRQLTELDPSAAQKILPSNSRRIVRALEVIRLTGKPFSASLPAPGPARYDTIMIGLEPELTELDARINARVEHMFAAGLVAEVHALIERGLRRGVTAPRALGYRQVLDALDGKCDMQTALENTATATRQFVRKQLSWFRRDKRITWYDPADPDLLSRLGQVG